MASAPKSSTGRPMPKNNNTKENYMYRDTSHFDPDQFKMTLSNQLQCSFRLLQLDTANDIDTCFSKFIDVVKENIDKHAPLKKATRKKRKLINKSWITKGILIFIKKKQKLYAKCYKSGSEFEKWLYKIYANKLTKAKRLSKKLFLQQEIVNSRHDMRKFWGIMKTLLPNNQELNSPDFVSVEGTKVTDKNEIADCFNNHFCSIGQSLADKIVSSSSTSFCNYLQNRVNSSMFLRPTSPTEIYKVIFQLNSNKSCGFDGINAKFVIIASLVLSPILSILINACFDLDVFPSILKIAKVIPVFKAGGKGKVSNYRSISLLSVFSKILEKLVYTRTVDFLNSHSVLVPTQYGFRPKFSAIHAVLDIITSCYDNMAVNIARILDSLCLI